MSVKGVDTASFVLALVILANCLIIAIWDIWVWYAMPPGHSVSSVLWAWSTRFPALPLAVGFLLGHLLWPLRIFLKEE